MSDDDFEFDDDEDFELDESGVDDDSAFEDVDDEPESDEPAPEKSAKPAKPAKPFDPNAKVPFFKNWVWWTSLIAALPAGFLIYELIQGFIGLSESLNIMWLVTMGITAFCAATAVALPILIALGKFLGGKEVTAAPGVVAKGKSGSQPEKSDIAATPDDFEDDEQDLFDSEDGLPELQDSEVFGDDEFDDDDF